MACAAADIVMMSDNLLRLPATVQLCALSRSIIVQNCVICILIKIVAVVIAVMGKWTANMT
jgi:cation transport ATPase